jgi:hypothetical protein
MATFSTNQVRQLYVFTAVADDVKTTDVAGTIAAKADSSNLNLYFKYKGVENLMRSDLINIPSIDNFSTITCKRGSKQQYKLKKQKVGLDASVNGGLPIAGQDYILRIVFRQYIGMSDEDQYFKYGIVHAYTGMTAAQFYEQLAISLWKNFSRELVTLLQFEIAGKVVAGVKYDSANSKNVLIDSTGATIDASTATDVTISEVAQEWVLGIKEQVPVYFTLVPTSVLYNSDEVIWGKATDVTSTEVIKNGHKIADLEYFCMGERGDIYRNVGWPHTIPTKYLVDPTKEYDIMDIHYYTSGSNEGVQKSEKTITLVTEANTLTTSTSAMDTLIEKIKAVSSDITINWAD